MNKMLGCALASGAFCICLVLPWNFDRTLSFDAADNPLWTEQRVARDTALTRALNKEGFTFRTNRGNETSDGICFGDFRSDEYWVIEYFPEDRQVGAYAWILKINFLGHIAAARRFKRLETILRTHLVKSQHPSLTLRWSEELPTTWPRHMDAGPCARRSPERSTSPGALAHLDLLGASSRLV